MTATRAVKNLASIAIGLFAAFTLTFLVAEHFGLTEEAWVREQIDAVAASGGGRAVAAAAVFLLLALDLALPVPSSIVMTLAGALLGPALGTAVASAGALASALAGYALCRRFGERVVLGVASAEDRARVERFMDRYGSFAIVLSRPVPMLTEIVSCVAGLTGVPFRRFLALSIAGTVPISAVYAWAGARAGGAAGLGWPLLIAIVLPAAGLAAVRWWAPRRD